MIELELKIAVSNYIFTYFRNVYTILTNIGSCQIRNEERFPEFVHKEN